MFLLPASHVFITSSFHHFSMTISLFISSSVLRTSELMIYYQTNSTTSDYGYFGKNFIFLPTTEAKKEKKVLMWKGSPMWSFHSSAKWLGLAPPFLILQTICVCLQWNTDKPDHGRGIWLGRGVGCRWLARLANGRDFLEQAWQVTAGPSRGPHLPPARAPGHQKEMYLIFKSLPEPKRIPAKQP